MTRKFNQVVNCPLCGFEFPAESAFCTWMRHQEELDSIKEGILRADLDHIVHRCRFPNTGRDVQAIMIIEVKTHVNFKRGSHIPDSQADSLHLINQLARNRRSNMHKRKPWQRESGIRKARSLWSNRDVWIRFYGVHGLYFSGSSPLDSHRIEWDHKEVSTLQLISLLRFELDPDSLRAIDLRIHQRRQGTLFPTGKTTPPD